MRIARGLGLEINVFGIRQPTQNTATKCPSYAGSGNPSFIPLPVQSFQLSGSQIQFYDPSIFVVEGAYLQDSFISVRRKMGLLSVISRSFSSHFRSG